MLILSRPILLLSLLSLTAAKYFSEGWKPGQAAKTALNPGATFNPKAQADKNADQPAKGGFASLLTSGPIGALLNRAGINMTQRLEEARLKEENKWDKRIPLITDFNYNDVIVNEKLAPEDEFKRVWFLIITVTAGQNNGISQMFDKRFDEAYDLTAKAKDLKHVKWGRIDYMNVTTLTTKWAVWRGPTIVILSDRGQTLRFLNARTLRPQPELMRQFLLDEKYLQLPVWKSSFAPGGKYEFVMEYLAIAFEKWYQFSTSMPRWLLYILSGGLASILIQLMHRGDKKPKLQKPEAVTTETTTPAEESTSTSAKPTATGNTATKRKTRSQK